MSAERHVESYLGMNVEALQEAGAYWTAREIAQQPVSWYRTQALLQEQAAGITAYLAPLTAVPGLRIILTGAGSSAFIGECLAPLLAPAFGRIEAIATTDILSAPHLYLHSDIPTLLVSFGRSGSSPESVAVVELAERIVKRCHQLVFTCNIEGKLFQRCRDRPNSLAILLPPETHDQSFAMTSSFSSMLLAAWLVLGGDSGADVDLAAQSVQRLIEGRNLLLRSLAGRPYSRVVYLGSNNLKALAREAALKLLELTDGRVVAIHDSPLGFRHGPKTIVNSDTLIVVFVANNPYTRAYDLDLLRELRADARAGKVIAITAKAGDEAEKGDHMLLDGLSGCGDGELALACVAWAQLYAFHRALSLGNKPDQPSASGTVNRVVSGVTIHGMET